MPINSLSDYSSLINNTLLDQYSNSTNSLNSTDSSDFLKTNLLSGLLSGAMSQNNSSSSSFSVMLQSLLTSMQLKENETVNTNLPGVKLESLPTNFTEATRNYGINSSINQYYNSMLSNAYGNNSFSKVEKITVKDKRIEDAVNKACEKYNMDKNLVLSVIKQESDFNPNSKSHAGAMGLMQLMPENCVEYGVSNPYNIEENIDAGVRHLKDMIKSQKGNVILGLAAYNAGPGTLRRRGVTSVDHISKLPSETRNYVKKVSAYYKSL